jgi:hypothetical protein
MLIFADKKKKEGKKVEHILDVILAKNAQYLAIATSQGLVSLDLN